MSEAAARSFNTHLRERFGCRVHRVAVDGGFSCPNLDGTRGLGGCRFCDMSGSLASYAEPKRPIADQVRLGIERIARRTKARKFIVYFQAFTATHAPPERLRTLCDEALAADERVVGLAVGARPDCLGEPILDVLEEFHRKTYLWIDVGLETVNNQTLERMNRRTTTAEFVEAMRRAKARGLRICAHVIFGLPGDSPDDMMRAIDLVNELALDGIKIHNLYIDARSALAVPWRRGEIPMMGRDTYVDLVCRALEKLRPGVLVHRLTGEAPGERHLAPEWARDKNRLLEAIRAEMRRRGMAPFF
ncbi:MAG: TIGR01212 family radical SAM protein [Candidatus Sumerlaeota bacterium]|nr:TIGR01212 family radical SAM protein [Candidatus Sumerlaeota bacterium]